MAVPRPPDRESLPLPKRPRPAIPSPAVTSISHSEDYDDIQEVVPVKTEPRDPLPPADDQLAYQEENYEDYSQYEVGQEYEGGMRAEGVNKGDLQVVSTEEGHQCLLCGAVMKHMRNLKRHFVDKHSEQQSHVCQFCKKSYKSRNSMETHQYLYHKEET